MIGQITKEVKVLKESGTKRVRVIFFENEVKNGKEIPLVKSIMEFETENCFLKSNQFAASIRTPILNMGKYDSYKVESVK
jgi:hypothetical protein